MSEPTAAAKSWAVFGRVQGVGFRWFVRKQAERIGVTGWVRNEPHGSVAVMAAGTESQLESFEAVLRKGPIAARVDRLELRAEMVDAECPPTFEIR